MDKEQRALARKNIESKLGTMRRMDITPPRRGWIRAIRDALGMTTTQLAKRLGVSQPRINALEKSEAAGTTTLKSLAQAAHAMDCTLIYAIVPNRPLDEMILERIKQRVATELEESNHTMLLENQAVKEEWQSQMRQRLIQKWLNGSERTLWEEEGNG